MLELALLALFAPVGGFLALAILPFLRRSGLAAGVVSSAFAVTSLVAALIMLVQVLADPGMAPVVALVDWLPHQGRPMAQLGIRVDGISVTMTVVVTLVATCVQVYSLGYMATESRPAIGRYFAWQSLFLFSMLSLVLAPDMLQAFLGWELVGLCSYLLIGFYYQKPSAAKAAVKAFWVTKFADMGLLLGVVLMRLEFGSFSWEGVPAGPAASLVALFVFFGVMGKSAQFPLHVWLPDAMEGPTPVSALLHAATMVAAGVYLVVRAWPLFEVSGWTLDVMVWIGAITAFLAGTMALVQDDIKKVLAYSTCSQLGYMVAALGAGSKLAGYLHLTTHAFFKALLFLAAGAAIHAVHSNSIHDMGGLWKKLRGTSILFLIGTLALVGIPVFSGFFSKDLILEALQHDHQWGPLTLAVAGVALTAFYMGRVVFIAFFGSPRKPGGHYHTPWVMSAPMWLLAVLATFSGFGAATLAEVYGGEHYHFAITGVGMTALVLGLGGIALAWGRYSAGKVPEFTFLAPLAAFIRSGPLDRFYEGAWRGGLLVVARSAGWFDRYVIDGLMNLIGWSVMEGSERARKVQTGRVPDYVFAVILGFVILAAWSAVAGGVQ